MRMIYSQYLANGSLCRGVLTSPMPLPFRVRYSCSDGKKVIDYSKDYYEVLDLPQNVEAIVIKNKFYDLAKQYHPDRSQGNEEKFKLINQAYAVLGDPLLRKDYDSNRRGKSEFPEEGESNQRESERTLNFEPYSKISRAKWANYRKGWRRDEHTNHYNYFKNTKNPQMAFYAAAKEINHWQLPLSLVTDRQLQQQFDRQRDLLRKQEEEARSYYRRKEQMIEEKVQRVRNFLNKTYLGSKIACVMDYFLEKQKQAEREQEKLMWQEAMERLKKQAEQAQKAEEKKEKKEG